IRAMGRRARGRLRVIPRIQMRAAPVAASAFAEHGTPVARIGRKDAKPDALPMQSRNLAARVGRWSAQHRKTAILGWIAFVVLATVLGGSVGKNMIKDSATGNGESKRGDMIVDAAGFPDKAGEQVLIQGKSSDDPAVTAAVKDVVGRLERIKGI